MRQLIINIPEDVNFEEVKYRIKQMLLLRFGFDDVFEEIVNE